MRFQESFRATYQGLFKQDRIDELSAGNPLTEEYNNKWGWYKLVRDLAKEDLTRFDEMTDLNLYSVFNDLSFVKETANYKEYLKTPKK